MTMGTIKLKPWGNGRSRTLPVTGSGIFWYGLLQGFAVWRPMMQHLHHVAKSPAPA